jgi:hypothetical protein
MVDMKPLLPLVGLQGWRIAIESSLSANCNCSNDLDVHKLSM